MNHPILSVLLFLFPGQMPVRVETAVVDSRPVQPTITLVGTVRPARRSVVAAQVGGFVAELPVDIGDRVTQGDALCRLRSDVRRWELDRATAELERLSASARESDAMRRKWEFERDRLKGLWDKRQGSEKEYRDALAEYDGATARNEATRFAAEAQRAIVERARDDLEQCNITAPFAAVVLSKRTEIGQWVEQGGEIAELLDLTTARVRVNAPEAAVPFITIGDEVTVKLDALPTPLRGPVGRIAPEGDDQARTFPVDVDLPNADGRMAAGMFARVDVPNGPRQQRLVVPKDAVLRRESHSVLFVIREGPQGAMAMPISVASTVEVEDRIAVVAPELQAGDRVVTRGNERLFGPSPVILPPPTTRSAPPETAAEPKTPAPERAA